jgi:hypothetical protein
MATLDAAGTPPNAHEREECARRRCEHVEEWPRAERATRPEAAAARTNAAKAKGIPSLPELSSQRAHERMIAA